MSLQDVPVGRDVPNDVNVIIEIPMHSPAVKYEIDKDSGALFLDRMLKTAMHYPCNYGYIPHTLCGDGDPTDVMVVMPVPVVSGVVVTCRPVGLLRMEDESGEDAKILAVPTEDITGLYRHVHELEHVDESASGSRSKAGRTPDRPAGRFWNQSSATTPSPKNPPSGNRRGTPPVGAASAANSLVAPNPAAIG
jgi:inorganic pyrophosphatase